MGTVVYFVAAIGILVIIYNIIKFIIWTCYQLLLLIIKVIKWPFSLISGFAKKDLSEQVISNSQKIDNNSALHDPYYVRMVQEQMTEQYDLHAKLASQARTIEELRKTNKSLIAFLDEKE